MGSPAAVSDTQYAALERGGGLTLCGASGWRPVTSGTMTTRFELPRQGVFAG